MPRKTPGGSPPPPAPPKKRRKQKVIGVAKASKDAAKRTRVAERAIRAGEEPPKRTTAEEIALAERRLEALELAKAGWTYQQIGEGLDPPCNRGQAKKLVDSALEELRAEAGETAEHVRAMQLQRLDAMMLEPLKNATKGDPQSIAAVLKIMERQAALVGADAPKKSEMTGKDGGPFQVVISAAEGQF